MFDILVLNKISNVGLSKLPEDTFRISSDIDNLKGAEGILVRSYAMHDLELPQSLLAIARAGAGTNNIPIAKCSERGIPVFNSPGANSNAVKELVISSLLFSSRNVIGGIEWVKSLKGNPDLEALVEKGKSQFIGPEIMGKRLGVIGLGAVGVKIANAANDLGMEVLGFDPFLSVDAAWNLSSSVIKAGSIEELIKNCDYITMHIPLNDSTKYMFNKDAFALMKKGVRLLNFSRGELVDNQALKEAIENGTVAYYITDFPCNEVLELDHVIALPHIGASTPESEENCASMAALELKEYLETGNIRNSVNFPACSLPLSDKSRVSIAHKNVVNMVGPITTAFANEHINIAHMINTSRGDWAYTLIEVDDLYDKGDELVKNLEAIDGVTKARIIIQ